MAGVKRDGFGTPGYCKLCSLEEVTFQDALDKRVGKRRQSGTYVYSPRKINEWLVGQGLDAVDRGVLYRHRKHVMHPKDRLVSSVQKREVERGVQPQQVNEDAFLDSLINLGNARIVADPGAVTVDQALKAVQIKKGSGKMGSGIQVLVGLMTGGPSRSDDTVIEGEVQVIS